MLYWFFLIFVAVCFGIGMASFVLGIILLIAEPVISEKDFSLWGVKLTLAGIIDMALFALIDSLILY